MSLSNLIDLLAQKTEQYTQLLSEKKLGEEYEECKKIIQILQSEIENRNQSNASGSEIKFEEPDTTL
jgi:hypothetical protein